MSDPLDDLQRTFTRRGTKAQIIAESGGTIEGLRLAFATDTNEFGVCTNGTWTWIAAGSGVSGFATPALTLGTSNAAGSATTTMRSDATVAVFDATAPTTSAIGDAAATGSATVTARRDHKHGREALSTATPLIESGSGAVGTSVLSSREDHVHPTATPSSHTHVDNVLYSGTGSQTVWYLPAAPLDAYSIAVFVAGTRSQDWALSGADNTTITFGSAPASGTNNVAIDINAALI